jgi:anti-sigma factor RsiW
MVDGTRITCQEVVEVVTDYLEGRMSPDDVAVFEAHLELCDGCKWYVDQMRVTIATVGRIEETDVPDAMRDTLTAAFRRRTAR